MKSTKKPVLGVDFGSTLTNPDVPKGTFSSLTWEKLFSIKPFDGALQILTSLRPSFEGIYLVSKCSLPSEANIRLWLNIHGFGDIIPAENRFFCRERHGKLPICKRLGITHFVDDRREVLSTMGGIVSYLFRFGDRQDEPERFNRPISGVREVSDWKDLGISITTTL